MEKFCKLFETAELGQLVVMISRNDKDNPEVRMFAQPENLGVCSVAASYSDDVEGWNLAEDFFNRIDEAKAIEFSRALFTLPSE